MTHDETAELVRRAVDGDERAWSELIASCQGLLLHIARRYRLDDAAAEDAVQNTWLRLYEHAATLHRPEQVVGWLVTTVRRECLDLLRKRQRETVSAGEDWDGCWGQVDAAEDEVVREDESRQVRHALRLLPERQRRLMTVLTFAPELDYREVSRALAMPIGSIGPTRGRALTRLREILDAPASSAA